MGYYSDVAIGMKKEDGVRFLSEFAMSVKDSFLSNNGFTMRQYPEHLVFSWDDVKWYREDKGVQWVENFVNELNYSEKPVAFVRRGEFVEDCEEWSQNDDDFNLLSLFYLNRSIEFAPAIGET